MKMKTEETIDLEEIYEDGHPTGVWKTRRYGANEGWYLPYVIQQEMFKNQEIFIVFCNDVEMVEGAHCIEGIYETLEKAKYVVGSIVESLDVSDDDIQRKVELDMFLYKLERDSDEAELDANLAKARALNQEARELLEESKALLEK